MTALLCSTVLHGKTAETIQSANKTNRFGIIFSYDLAFNFPDKLLSSSIGRKWIIGLSVADKKRNFIGFIGAGFKGWKLNFYSPVFQEAFINDVKKNYTPINGASEDSIIGAKIYSSPGNSLWGTYAGAFQVGIIILKNKFKPTFSFYSGFTEYLLHDREIAKYEDPEHGDIDYVGMSSTFYEFKIGAMIPIKNKRPFSAHLNIGYKLTNYGLIKFKDTPLEAYTTGNLSDKYNKTGIMTISISFTTWSNWRSE